MVLIGPHSVGIENLQYPARFAPRIAVFFLLPLNKLADLPRLLNVSGLRLALKLPNAGQYKNAAFTAHVTKRGPNRIVNNVRLHVAVTMSALHFLTSFILCPQHATHRTALWACVFHPHFLHFSFRYMLSPPPSDRFASLLSSATPS